MEIGKWRQENQLGNYLSSCKNLVVTDFSEEVLVEQEAGKL